jgi:hypothetical protein
LTLIITASHVNADNRNIWRDLRSSCLVSSWPSEGWIACLTYKQPIRFFCQVWRTAAGRRGGTTSSSRDVSTLFLVSAPYRLRDRVRRQQQYGAYSTRSPATARSPCRTGNTRAACLTVSGSVRTSPVLICSAIDWFCWRGQMRYYPRYIISMTPHHLTRSS